MTYLLVEPCLAPPRGRDPQPDSFSLEAKMTMLTDLFIAIITMLIGVFILLSNNGVGLGLLSSMGTVSPIVGYTLIAIGILIVVADVIKAFCSMKKHTNQLFVSYTTLKDELTTKTTQVDNYTKTLEQKDLAINRYQDENSMLRAPAKNKEEPEIKEEIKKHEKEEPKPESGGIGVATFITTPREGSGFTPRSGEEKSNGDGGTSHSEHDVTKISIRKSSVSPGDDSSTSLNSDSKDKIEIKVQKNDLSEKREIEKDKTEEIIDLNKTETEKKEPGDSDDKPEDPAT